GAVDAQPRDGVARPAAALGLARELLLGLEDAVAALRREVTAEILLVTKQPEPVLHLPRDGDVGRDLVGQDRKLRARRRDRQAQQREQARGDEAEGADWHVGHGSLANGRHARIRTGYARQDRGNSMTRAGKKPESAMRSARPAT